ncbi:glycerophosphodiester phosphodiesterase family protein [Pontibacter ruber]|nr:glycerophosphodiester phosphodiesterase family protein [Pontibacter ruber]
MAQTPAFKKDLPQLPTFDTEGHRGARGLLPENTIPAMIKALELGVTTLEMDTHITKDGQVILSHDPYINREHELLPNGHEITVKDKKKYVLYQLDYDKVKAFDAGSKQHPKFPDQQTLATYKPLLSEVIDSVQAYIKKHQLPQVFYNIETKTKPSTDGKYHPEPKQFIKLLMDVLEEKEIRQWVIIQSFDVRTLQVLHDKYPHMRTSLLVENLKGLERNLQSLGFNPDIYSPYYKLVIPKLIENCHCLGIKVIPWTVNNLEEMKQLKAAGVDGLISDYPNLFKEL